MKITARMIKLTPGPGDYENLSKSNLLSNNHNYQYRNGGL
jgi:hypothetical protein